ncbi:unnamed protein product, partial [Ectocarpus sp. 8 AP-2014]
PPTLLGRHHTPLNSTRTIIAVHARIVPPPSPISRRQESYASTSHLCFLVCFPPTFPSLGVIYERPPVFPHLHLLPFRVEKKAVSNNTHDTRPTIVSAAFVLRPFLPSLLLLLNALFCAPTPCVSLPKSKHDHGPTTDAHTRNTTKFSGTSKQ